MECKICGFYKTRIIEIQEYNTSQPYCLFYSKVITGSVKNECKKDGAQLDFRGHQ